MPTKETDKRRWVELELRRKRIGNKKRKWWRRRRTSARKKSVAGVGLNPAAVRREREQRPSFRAKKQDGGPFVAHAGLQAPIGAASQGRKRQPLFSTEPVQNLQGPAGR